jgi:acetolactate synthase-1/2/3 large subunit
MNGAELLVRALELEGVHTIFGYPGGAILPFYDALLGSRLRHVLVRHEQAAAMAADGYARVTGEVGVCVATSGPGATNLLTGIANAYLDSVPMVAITGQVPTDLLGTDAFQEVDVLGITMPVVKDSVLVTDPSHLPSVIQKAFQVARSGRPGPVVIDIPKDILLATMTSEPREPLPDRLPAPPSLEALSKAQELLQQSQRPLAYVGGGVRLAGAVEHLRRFIMASRIPTVQTLKGLGSLTANDPCFLGMLGMHGHKAANYAVQECDLLICVGARFDDRVTGALQTFAPLAKVIHLDLDPAEVGKRRLPEAPVVGDIRLSLTHLTGPLLIEPWRARCQWLKSVHGFDYHPPSSGLFAPRFLRDLGRSAQEETFICCDVGQHQMWVAQHYPFIRPENHLTSGGLGAMGYGLPAAIGAQFARPEATVINVSGDGSFMMNIQELATVARYKLPIKMVVMDNHCLGMVRQWQEVFLDKRYSEVDLSDNPDFMEVARAFGIPAMRLAHADESAAVIDAIHHTDGPLLVHALIDPAMNVWPLVPPGHSNADMLEESP